jgi:hypothetical protein
MKNQQDTMHRLKPMSLLSAIEEAMQMFPVIAKK